MNRRFALLGMLSLALPVTAEPPRPKFAELSRGERSKLDQQRALVLRVLRNRYGVSAADLPTLQRLVDDKVFSAAQTHELQSIGVAFGDVLARELGLRWVVVTDEYGTDPTLRYRDTSIQVNALTMVSKRVEEGRAVDLRAILEGVRAHVADVLKSGDYQ